MKVTEVVAVLRNTTIFHDVDDRALNVLAFSGVRVPFAEGDVLVKTGEGTGAALVILSGEVTVDTGTRTALAACGPSSIVGELALLAGRDAAATVRATADGEALKIDRDLFEKVVSEFPEIATRLKHGMLERMAGMMRDLGAMETLLRQGPDETTTRRGPPAPERGRRAAPSPASPRRR